MGLVALGYTWCRITEAALARPAVDEAAGRTRHKLATGRFFVDAVRLNAALHLGSIRPGAGNVTELPAEAF
jgi:hypothetical protein